MHSEFARCLDNPAKIIDTAASKRSPFKFPRVNASGDVEMNLGSSIVALPDGASDFGREYLAVIVRVQDLWEECMPTACKRQTVPHMSIGSVVLDKSTPPQFNAEVRARAGLLAASKAELDRCSPLPRARIQTLKINPDGCVTFQLEHDPSQDVLMAEQELDAALARIPTCQGDAALGEKKKFKMNDDGTYTVTRFQQVRLALGGLGCEIKGLWPSGHMVVINLVDPGHMKEVPAEKLARLFAECHAAFTPLVGKWFELAKLVCLVYVERSLNEGNVVAAPRPGDQPRAFPDSHESAQAMLGGIFVAEPNGDVLLDIENFRSRMEDKAGCEWLAFDGEVREMADQRSHRNSRGSGSRGSGRRRTSGAADQEFRTDDEMMRAEFSFFDADGNGFISHAELKKAMANLGEELSDDQIKAMMAKADTDRDGTVSYEEFLAIMHHARMASRRALVSI